MDHGCCYPRAGARARRSLNPFNPADTVHSCAAAGFWARDAHAGSGAFRLQARHDPVATETGREAGTSPHRALLPANIAATARSRQPAARARAQWAALSGAGGRAIVDGSSRHVYRPRRRERHVQYHRSVARRMPRQNSSLVTLMPFRKLRFGMVGGGPGAFIGAVHRRAATLNGLAELVAGAFSADPEKSRAQGRAWHLSPARVYGSYEEMAEREAALPAEQRI